MPGTTHVTVDQLSRVTLDDQKRVHPNITTAINNTIGQIPIDRFAIFANKVTEPYNSYYMEIESAGTDAFSQQNYMEECNYMFPPISLIGRTLQFIEYTIQEAKIICIVPKWEA